MTDITTLRPGEHFMFKGFEWVCLDPHSKEGGVLAIMAEPWRRNVRFCPDKQHADENGNRNNYRTSKIRKYLADTLAYVLGANNLLLHETDLIADNGDCAYGAVEDPVFILTCDEYRKYRDYIPRYDSWIWTATPWCCGDKDSDTGGAGGVRIVGTGGLLNDVDGAYYSGAVAPACILNPKSLNLRQSMACVEEVAE